MKALEFVTCTRRQLNKIKIVFYNLATNNSVLPN